jgi:two-component system chemotaxis response regulator CheB
MNTPIRVVLADDSPTARQLIGAILSSDGGFTVVGEAGNGAEAVDLAERLEPDLVIMDVHMPVLDGLDATREIMTRSPRPILIVSAVSARDVDLSLTATEAGALMALPKPPGPDSPRFPQLRDQLIAMARAMAHVKVVRRWQRERRMRPRSRATVTRSGAIQVVGIAASTGGPAALRTILGELPRDFPAPILLVQHIASDFTHGFAEWLGADTPLGVTVAAHGDQLQPATVYVAPEAAHLGVDRAGTIVLSSDPPLGPFRPSATYLFESLGHAYGPRAAAVVLTGMGSDGAEGLTVARRAGTFVIAQDEPSSVVFGMAREAIARDAVDCVLPLDRIAQRLLDLVMGALDEP